MTTRGRMDLNLGEYLEALVNAEQDVDQIAEEVLGQNKYNAVMLLYQNLRKTSEQWTGATAKTLFVEGPERDGNFIFIELGANTSVDPSAWYKEFGTPKQAAEPFLRPTLAYYRRGGLKQAMQAVLERLGLSL
jgi:hypothetical protein